MPRGTQRCVGCNMRKPKREFLMVPGTGNAEKPKSCWKYCQDCQKQITTTRALDPDKQRKYEMYHYGARDAILRSMGFASYAAYLKSDVWRRIRARVLALRNYQCAVCGGRAWMVHHQLYRKQELCGQSLKGMKAVCGPCHEQIEFDGRRKVGLVEASHRFYQDA